MAQKKFSTMLTLKIIDVFITEEAHGRASVTQRPPSLASIEKTKWRANVTLWRWKRVKTAELDIYLMRLMQLNRKHPFSKLFSSVWPTAICGGELSSHYRVLQIWHRCCDEYTLSGHDWQSVWLANLASQTFAYKCPNMCTVPMSKLNNPSLALTLTNNYMSK